MSAFVLDSSVALSWVFEDEFSAYSDFVVSRFDDSEVHVPSLWWLKVANSLMLAERKGRLDTESLARALEEVGALSVRDDPWIPSRMGAVTRVAQEFGLTCYEALYLELALRLEMPLATLDRQLAEAAQSVGRFLAPPGS